MAKYFAPRLQGIRFKRPVMTWTLLGLFRAPDRMDPTPSEIPQRLIRQLFDLDAGYAEALWALDQPPGTLDVKAMLRDTLAALEQLPEASARLRKNLPRRPHPGLARLEVAVRQSPLPAEAYNMVPGRAAAQGQAIRSVQNGFGKDTPAKARRDALSNCRRGRHVPAPRNGRRHVIHDLPPNPARGTASRRRLVRHFTGMTPEDKPQRSRLVYTNLHRLRQMENTGARGGGMSYSLKPRGLS